MKPKFHLGQVVATPGALEALEKAGKSAIEFITRHANGDWGDVGEEDAEQNEWAIMNGARVLSSYKTSAGEVIWVITEADRSLTTLLLPSEY